MTVPATRDALFIRMAELLAPLELFEFTFGEVELEKSQSGWLQIKNEVAAEVAAIKEETP